MIAISPRPVGRTWNTISFASTLYLCPILDLLLADIPEQWHAEVRLGLQEALVNAAKHGNQLDPSKRVVVRFTTTGNEYWWAIADQGCGFACPCPCPTAQFDEDIPHEEGECGRGLYILNQIFDRVHWNDDGTELKLCKKFDRRSRLPLVW
ncbi:ATP-binding protein [Oxynema aestuarii]|uniref:Anti-sigma regulatory factor n=1 Tax=Oxynema aestuarii AP17 TaxID=2064643 RepID=A0A6H1TYE4_9CYAN|nr:anti-sigma regulatory factor [Oxynema aestuarii]QIZ71425.1 anti-sigma regulatory factor [Oxynema aestuarii AP17]RMH77054.1 MAG: anti-sigma regulatory factor [Cyanobacteria bacterium J007]